MMVFWNGEGSIDACVIKTEYGILEWPFAGHHPFPDMIIKLLHKFGNAHWPLIWTSEASGLLEGITDNDSLLGASRNILPRSEGK